MTNLVWLSLLPVIWLISSTVTAGEVLYQRYFGGDVQKPASFEETITLPRGKAPYLLNLVNGNPEGNYRLSSITLVVNGTPIIGPKDLNPQTEAVNRSLAVLETNQLTLTVRGPTEGFVQVTILGETVTPEPIKRLNSTQDNSDGSLMGLNMGGHIVIWFEGIENASTYILYVAPTPTGPWQAIQHLRPISLLMSTVDDESEETTETGEPRQEIGDTTYYKMEAQDAHGEVLKNYSVLTVPPYVEEEPLVLPGLSSSKPAQVPPASCQIQSPSVVDTDPCHSSCIQNQAFISETDFVNSGAMTLQNIRDLLETKKSLLRGDSNHQITDVDGQLIDPAKLVSEAATTNHINPQVLLATIQKESSAVTTSERSKAVLRLIAGYGNPSTIRQQIAGAASKLRRDYDSVTGGTPTIGGWNLGTPHDTEEDKLVCPYNAATAVLYQYTPYVGKYWGGEAGGNQLFFESYYDKLRFGTKPLFCGAYTFASPSPQGESKTPKPTLSVQIQTADSCKTNYTLTLDSKKVATGTLSNSQTISYIVPSPLKKGTHKVRTTVKSTECDTRDSTDWRFQVTPGKKVALVVDDTGSMAEELEAVKTALSQYIASLSSPTEAPEISWNLITFKDEVTQRGTTTEANLIQSWVASLYAGGGGDCPEESLGALQTATSLLAGGEETHDLILVTDASPHGGWDTVNATITALQTEHIRVHTLLTGDCAYYTARSSMGPESVYASTVLSARAVFSKISADTQGLFFYLPQANVDTLTQALVQIFQQTGGTTDITPPELTLEVSPKMLWPPNHKMVEIAPIWSVHDDTDLQPQVTLMGIQMSEPEEGQGSGNTANDVLVSSDGRIFLRAERSKSGNSRLYTITYRATDASGNTTTTSADVLVPRSFNGK